MLNRVGGAPYCAFRWVNKRDLDAAFTGVDGQLRYAQREDGRFVLQGDVNGDQKADFEVVIFGTITPEYVIL